MNILKIKILINLDKSIKERWGESSEDAEMKILIHTSIPLKMVRVAEITDMTRIHLQISTGHPTSIIFLRKKVIGEEELIIEGFNDL